MCPERYMESFCLFFPVCSLRVQLLSKDHATIQILNSLQTVWYSVEATSTFALWPLGRRCESKCAWSFLLFKIILSIKMASVEKDELLRKLVLLLTYNLNTLPYNEIQILLSLLRLNVVWKCTHITVDIAFYME